MLPSSARVDKKKANLIDAIVALVREKIPKPATSQVESFVRHYYARVAPEDLVEGDVADLYGAAIAHWNLLRKRAPGAHTIRIYNPNLQEHGWRSTHTIIETVTDDRPFLVDSISMALNRRGFTLHLIIHPIVGTVVISLQ
jgi:glutamate dehydrogenase